MVSRLQKIYRQFLNTARAESDAWAHISNASYIIWTQKLRDNPDSEAIKSLKSDWQAVGNELRRASHDITIISSRENPEMAKKLKAIHHAYCSR